MDKEAPPFLLSEKVQQEFITQTKQEVIIEPLCQF